MAMSLSMRRSASGFRPAPAFHERAHRGARSLAPEYYVMHLAADGEFNALMLRESGETPDGIDPFHGQPVLLEPGEAVTRRQAAARQEVAGGGTGAGRDDVAEPGKPVKRFSAPAGQVADAHQLVQAPRDYGCGRVVPESEARAHAGSERDDVFHGPARFHAPQV